MDKAPKLEFAQEILGHEFKDPSLLWEALQAPGSGVVSHAGRMYTNEGHKPLAGIGDTLLSLYIKDQARNQRQTVGKYHLGSAHIRLMYSAAEHIAGVATHNLKAMANNHRLAEICDANELTGCISGNPAQQGAVSPRTKSDTVEAVLGAIYKDGNDDMEPVKVVMLRLGITLFSSSRPEACQGLSREGPLIALRVPRLPERWHMILSKQTTIRVCVGKWLFTPQPAFREDCPLPAGTRDV